MNEEMREGVEIPEIQDIDMFRFVYAFQPMVTESHEDAFELLYLKSGQKPFKIGNREWTLVGGDLAVIPPGVEHGQNSVQNRSSLYFMLLSEPEKCENFLFMDQTARCELQKRLLKCAGRPIHLPPVVQKSFQQLLDMQKGDAPESQSLLAPALVRAHLTLLLESILAEIPGTPYTLTEGDLAEIARLKAQRYDTWQWNYGKSPECTLRKRARFPGCGIVEAFINMDQARIRDITFRGDFFAAEDPGELSRQLAGCPLEADALGRALCGVDVSRYFLGMELSQFLELLTR